MAKTFRGRVEWAARTALLVFVLAAAAFLSAVTAIRFAIRGSEVAMPDLVGKSTPEARGLLESAKLEIKISDRVFSSLPAGDVVRQSPPAGEMMKVGQDAHVVLSLGAQTISIPQLIDESLRAAEIELLRAGLQPGEVSTCYLPGLPPDAIVVQDPAPGMRAVTPRVDLLVSEGDRPVDYVMPSFVGLTETDAMREIAAAGLRIGKLNVLATAAAAKDTVVAETPAAGARVGADVAIDLDVAP
ncbi:MAG: PASTA domain-containing protein [Candidatus Acidiferrales bacterium]